MSADRIIEWWKEIPTLPAPAPDVLRPHLLEHNQVPAAVLDVHEPAEHQVWHTAEHDQRHPGKRQAAHSGHLGHTHPKWLPKAAQTTEKAA